MRPLAHAAALSLALPVISSAQSADLLPENLGLVQFYPIVASDHRAVFAVDEYRMKLDLNRDGDVFDEILHLYDAQTGEVENLGFAGGEPVLRGDLLVVYTSEQLMGGDQTGDGDCEDGLMRAVDLATGEEWIYDVGGYFPGFRVEDDLISFQSPETEVTGDLNGDGDIGDDIPRVLLRTGELLEYPWALGSQLARHGFLGVGAHEAAQGGVDVNGDGDTYDFILHLAELSTGEVLDTGLVARVRDISPEVVLLTVSEYGQEQDFNGDGDQKDSVAHVYDRSDGCLHNLALAINDGQLHGRSLVLEVGESFQDEDWNGDGDKKDAVLVYRAEATQPGVVVGTSGGSFHLDEERLLFHQSEVGADDLNGDGDTLDRILTSFELESQTLVGYGIPTMGLWDACIAPEGVLVYVYEMDQGQDLNRDGDLYDEVAHLVTYEDQTVLNFELGGEAVGKYGTAFTGRWATFWINEASQGGSDLNGDGDVLDYVTFLYDASTGQLHDYRIATWPAETGLAPGVFAFRASEWMSGVDFDGDGDKRESVIHVVDLPE